MTIAHDLGFDVRLDNLARSDLYIAEEIFLCGTAAEVTPVNSVDDRPVTCPGPMTKAIMEEYTKATRGQVDKYKDWVEHV
jgi:branched-chain amino acid aminotransferase